MKFLDISNTFRNAPCDQHYSEFCPSQGGMTITVKTINFFICNPIQIKSVAFG